MVRALVDISDSLERLAPRDPPRSATRTVAELWIALRSLISYQTVDSPSAVQLLLTRWLMHEEHAFHQARMGSPVLVQPSESGFRPSMASRPSIVASSSTSDLELLWGSVMSPLRTLTSGWRSGSIHASYASDLDAVLPASSQNAAFGDGGGTRSGGAAPLSRDRSIDMDRGQLETVLTDETPTDAELQGLEELRWVLLGRASLGLLRWWLMRLVEMSLKAAERSREQQPVCLPHG